MSVIDLSPFVITTPTLMSTADKEKLTMIENSFLLMTTDLKQYYNLDYRTSVIYYDKLKFRAVPWFEEMEDGTINRFVRVYTIPSHQKKVYDLLKVKDINNK